MKKAILLLFVLLVGTLVVEGRSVPLICPRDIIYDAWGLVHRPMPIRPGCSFDRCSYTRCPRYPFAECRISCPDCPVEFYQNGHRVYDCDIRVCPRHMSRVYCYHDPCAHTECPAYPHAICRRDYCGFCKARFYVGGTEVNCRSTCPDLEKPYTQCKVNPCDVSTCPRYTNAECVPNYCGGCHAEFYQSGVRIKSCKKRTNVPSCDSTLDYCPLFWVPKEKNECSLSRRCADDDEYCCHNGCYNQCQKRFHSCPADKPEDKDCVDPCLYAKCQGYPKATCKENTCGNCKAEFYQNGKMVQCDVPNCPSPLVNPALAFCLQDACGKDKPCSEDQYCCFSGCSNTCLFKPTPPPPVCPLEKPQVSCIADPCRYARCQGYPDAVCKSNYCGECKAEFFQSGEKVECDVPVCPPPLVDRRVAFCLGDVCGKDKACADGEYCCYSGCSNTCRKKPVVCPAHKPPVNCLVDPCKDASCYGFPLAVCKTDYCGECRARFYVNDVEVKCKPKYPVPNCPAQLSRSLPGRPCFNACEEDSDCTSGSCCYDGCGNICLNVKPGKGICPYISRPPTSYTDCTDKCTDDYSCSGLQVCCAVGCRKECIMSVPKHPPCKGPQALCSKDPCEGETCGGQPTAVCRSGYCGGCIAEWFDQNGKQVFCFVIGK